MDGARRSGRGTRRRRSGSPQFWQLLTAAVESAADSVAIRFNPTGARADQRQLTYGELDERSSQVARELIQRGIGPGDVVAIGIARSIESVLAVWAIAKAGAAYVPVDPNYPRERADFILADSGAVLGITTTAHRAAFGADIEWLELDDPAQQAQIAARPKHPISYADRARTLTEQHPAYVIYTSGSTGRPKGVVVTHTGLAGLVAAERDHYTVDSGARVLHVCSPNFDVSVLELLLTFSSGAALVISPPTVFGGFELAELVRREHVTHMLITPAALESVDPDGLDELRVVVVAGDAFGPGLVDRWAVPGRSFYNGYGPTEATILATSSAAMKPGEPVTIGSAIAGVGAFILDSRLRPVPAGVAGELYLSGPALAQGYLGRQGLTADRFVASPFGGDMGSPGARLYRTGDLVRRNESDGAIEYQGRTDFQVKIRGFRIELGEVDNALTNHPDIDFAATLGKTLPSGATALVSYVLARSGISVDVDALADFIGTTLPAYMVPSSIVVLDEIPLTPNGKLDRKALPEPVFEVTESRAPIGEIESRLAELFAQVLGVAKVGAQDSFFAIGGDSILSIQLVSRARAAGIMLTPQDVFEQRTVAGLARVAVVGAESAPVLAELPGGGVGEIPLTPVLAAYLEQGAHRRFTQNMVLDLPEGIDHEGLVATLAAVLEHHDILRSQLRRIDDQWRLETLPGDAIDADALLTPVDVPAGTDTAQLTEIAGTALDSAMSMLDPAAARMIAFAWLRRPDARDALIVAAHHYVIDGVSWRIIIPDLVTAWLQRAVGQQIALPAVGTSFRRWAHGLADAATTAQRRAELGYWQRVLTTADPLLGARGLNPAVDTHATVRRIAVQVPVEITDAMLTTLPALYRGGVNDGLLAALALAVRSWRAARGIDAPATRVRLEGHGREEATVAGADLTRTVGWFTTMYPVALDLSGIDLEAASTGGDATGSVVKAVKEQLLAVPDKGIGFGMLRYLNPITADALTGELGQIGFNYLGRISAGGAPEGLADAGWLPTGEFGEPEADQDSSMPAAAVVDINAIVTDTDAGPRMDVSFAYVTGILDERAVRELADEWLSALSALTAHVNDPAAGGLTPSDVPLVRVEQRELDIWQRERPGLVDVLPLSPLQSGLLFLTDLLAGSLDAYVIQLVVELAGDVDAARLRSAANVVLDRYDSLRVAFIPTADGTPVQVVTTPVEVPWRIAEAVPDAELPALMAADRLRGFDRTVAPLLRFTLYRTESGRTHLVLITHHILVDGWSMPLLMKDLLVLYATRGETTPLPRVRPYRDYLTWLGHQDRETTLRVWDATLAGAQPTLLAPTLPKPLVNGGSSAERADLNSGFGCCAFELTDGETAALSEFAGATGVTVNTVVQAAWGLLLGAGIGRDDVVFGATVSGRPAQLDGVDDMVGLFVNTIPVRVHLGADTSLRDTLIRLQAEQAALLDHHQLGLVEIQRSVGVDTLFDSLVVYESYPIDSEGLLRASNDIDGLKIVGLEGSDFTHYPVTVLAELNTRLRVQVKYRTDNVAAVAAHALADRLRSLLAQFIATPERTVAEAGELLASGGDVIAEVGFWRKTLEGMPDQLELPTDRPRPAVLSGIGGPVEFSIAAEVHRGLRLLAQQRDTTVHTVVHAAFAAFLARISGTADIAIGTPMAGNAVVLRTDVPSDSPFAAIVALAREVHREAFAHKEIPFEQLVHELLPDRAMARHPLFQVMLSQEADSVGLAIDIAKLDLSLAIQGFGDEHADLRAELTFARELFDESTMRVFADRFIRLLEQVVARPDIPVGDIGLLTAAEWDAVVRQWNDTARDIGAGKTLVDVFGAQVLATPDAVAIVDPGSGLSLADSLPGHDPSTVMLAHPSPGHHPSTSRSTTLTYAELGSRVRRLARFLIAAGVGPEKLVALGMRRSVDFVVAVYAVHEAGGGYVPLDLDQPVERVNYVLESAAPVCVLTTSRDGFDAGALSDGALSSGGAAVSGGAVSSGSGVRSDDAALSGGGVVPVLSIDELDLSGYSDGPVVDAERITPLRAENSAYVIFTSGSTGRPKGVAVPHSAVVNQIRWITGEFGIGADDVVLFKTPATFDVSVWELFGPLSAGGRLVVASPDGHRDPRYLAEVIAAERVTMTSFVPSMLTVFAGSVDVADGSVLGSLRALLVAGEAFTGDVVAAVRRVSSAALYNLYGPTEFAVHATYARVVEGVVGAVPIGGPVWNARAYVLDARLHPVPPGVAGELYLAGVQLARGYFGRPDLSSDRFVANPFSASGSRMYRTGDLVTRTVDGAIVYLGRTDFQVKLRGLRIELGEIETALTSHGSVGQAVALVRSDVRTGDQLVGYVVPAHGGVVDVEELRGYLSERLPSYMVPAAVVVLDVMPLNPNGKLDRKALPEPDFTVRAYRAPATDAEIVVSEIFANVLGADRIGLDDDFFELGGNSLIATRLVAQLGAALGLRIPVRVLFEAPTVAALAARAGQLAGSEVARPPLVARQRPERIPLSLAQQRMWVLNQIDPESPAYNIPMAIRLTGTLDVPALRLAVADVLTRHEVLRTRYPAAGPGGLPYQEILSVAEVLPDGLPVETAVDPIARITTLMSSGFMVTQQVPVRALLLTDNGSEHVLAIAVHHISADGVSLAPLARDLVTAYVARTAGAAPRWAPLPVQYADFAIWQHTVIGTEDDENSVAAQQLSYWREQLAGLSGTLELPLDHPRPAVPSMRGASTTITVAPTVHEGLIGLARSHDSTLFMVMHAALAALLARMSGSSDIAIGTPIAGRGERALDDLVGMFVNTLTLRIGIEAGASFDRLIDQAKDIDLSAFANADLPFERVAEALAPTRAASHNPLFQVALSFDNIEPPTLELPGLTVSAVDTGDVTAKFDLLVMVLPRQRADGSPGALDIVFTYATDLFEESTAHAFGRRLERILTAVAADAQATVGDIDILDEQERDPATTPTSVPRPQLMSQPRVETLPELMDKAVGENPDGVAVVFADATQTLAELEYIDLDMQSTRLARLLIRRGIGPEDAVAVGIPRSLESVVAVWAVAKAGAGFVPVDPNYPADRVAHMVSDSGAMLGLTIDSVRSQLPGEVEWLSIDSADLSRDVERYSADPVTDADRVRPLRAEHPAYVIYTSGSTGQPKGVVVTQGGLADFCAEQRDRYRLASSSRTLHFASPSFDASVLELLLAVGGAATMVVVSPSVYGGEELAAVVRRERVTHAFITPAALASVDPAGLDRLRVVVAGGEACPPELVRRWVIPISGRRTREFFNGYGPTETTIMTNISAPLVPGEPVTIGAPIRAVTEYTLDERLNRVPDRVAGELYIAGAGLARGYHDQPGLTAARFVANPFGPAGSRMYRTGDLVRGNLGGELEYLGRNDFQVKIRGFRIELGEIDAVLTRHDDIDFAVTIGHDLDTGATILVSYVHPVPGSVPDTGALTGYAATSLPAHMVPTTIMVLDEIPLTPVGKLDRRALPAPQLRAKEFRAPEGAMETAVADVFAELLEAERVGADDDFFELGGNSLIATRVIARLGAELDIQIPVRMLFEAPTVAGLSARLGPLAGSGGRRALTPMPRPELIPLSLAQQRMWFLNQFDTASAANNIPFAVRLSGALEVAALQAAVADLVERHETLRTIYPATDGTGHQVVLSAGQEVPDLTPRPLAASDLRGWLLETAGAGFDVATRVPLRMALAQLGVDDHVVVVVVHHIAADGASAAPLVRDLMTAYVARAEGVSPGWAPLPVQYVDYALWQREVLGDGSDPESVAAAQIEYWRAELAGIPDRLELPTDRPRPSVASGRGAVYAFEIPPRTHAELAELAQRAGTSLFMVVHTALAVLLARLSNSDDITIGTPVAGRGERALDDLIGMFVNTLVLRTRIDPAASFTELLGATKETDLAAFSNAELPFERLVEVLDPVRSQAHHPLFQVALFFQNLDSPTLELPGLTAQAVDLDAAVAKFDLQMTVYPRDERGAPAGLSAEFNYATDLFDESTMAEFADRFARIMSAIAADPASAVGAIDLLSSVERERILVGWNETRHPVAPELLLDGYRRAVAAHPDAVAIAYAGDELAHPSPDHHPPTSRSATLAHPSPDHHPPTSRSATLTYGEFDARVNKLARLLISRGVGAESLVGLAVRRSLDLVVGMYAIVTAGGAYVPLDPDHPVERIAHILDTAQPVCVVTTSADSAAVPVGADLVMVDDGEQAGFAGTPVRPEELPRPVLPWHPAYVIFTSGSTGRPKGVAVSHAAIHNQIAWMLTEYPMTTADVYLQKTATTFDVSLWGYFMPLRAGARLLVATPDGHRDPEYVAETIAAHRVTVTDFVPSMLTVFAAHTTPGTVGSLRDVFVIGEALPPATVAAFAAVSDANVHNLYGPTEAAVSVTYRPATADGRSVPIGVPEWNTQAYVLDGRLRPVPAGVAGELYLAGDQLARGYVARPDLTADRFVANPFAAGARMYRTGDLAVWRADGSRRGVLDYLGRTDFQVKFRGQRIELGEIETALLAQDSVSQAVAVVMPSAVGDQLVAYAVPTPGRQIDESELLAALTGTLPAYMIPAAIVALASLPLNTSGKLDRKALPEPTFASREFRAPATSVEVIVASVFAEVLGLDQVGVDDDFFALGGNSLIATQVVARLGVAIDARVPVRSLFAASTVGGLAAQLERLSGSGGRRALVAGPRPDRIPLSMAQQRMWFLNRFDATSVAYNLPIAVRLDGELDVSALRAAVADLVARHEVLRTVYPQTDAGPVQVILPPEQAVPQLSVETVASGQLESAALELLSTTFDVTSEVPLRAALFTVEHADDEPARYLLAMVVHHIAGDGTSMGPLTRDLMTAYHARRGGAAPEWAPLAVQYADYSIWQRELLGSADDPESLAARQVGYWRGALADLPDQLDLPADRSRPAVQSFTGGKIAVRIDAETHRALGELARGQGATLFMVVHAALAVLLARLSGTDDIAIGSPMAGRGDAALDDMIGMFVNTLVFRTRVDPAESFTDLLARQRDDDLQAFANADVPFERLVEVLNPVRSTARHPLFQVGLSFQNLAATSFELPGLTISSVDFDAAVSQFDLHWIIADSYDEVGDPTGIHGAVTYATDLFDEVTARDFVTRFARLLGEIAAAPRTAVGELELLERAERAELVSGRNATDHAADAAATLSSLLDATVAATPRGVALTDLDGMPVSYGELDARVNRLARHLISLGVGPESRVALALRRSVDLVVAMYAVVKSGAAYVPVDPDQAADRTAYILEIAAPVCVLTNADADFDTEAAVVVRLDQLDLDHLAPTPITDSDRVAVLRPAHTAYVIFTSGSTGLPKGVAVSNAAIVNQLLWKVSEFALGQGDAVLLKTAATFDLSVWEFWSAAVCGGRLVIAAPDGHRDPAYLNDLMARESVTCLHVVPSMLDALLSARLPFTLRRVLAIGEALPADLAQRFLAAYPQKELFNLYGPTEAAVSVTGHRVTDLDVSTVPIGAPAWNSRVYVLDSRLRPVPAGVSGELYLAGAQLARGYFERADLTADRFVANPFEPGTRMYRSGDLVAWNTVGELEYRGRTDFQVKIRGFRIELGEIEAALVGLPQIARAAVLAVADPQLGDRLVGYLVPADRAVGVDIAQVKSATAARLPSYMTPSAFVVLDALPLNVNGKLDRKALPAPAFETTAFRAPSTPIEEIVAGVFADVLGIERVGADDEFFALGGNSLLATQVAARLGAALDTRVPVRGIFEAPTVAGLAVQAGQYVGVGERAALVAGPRPEQVPLSLAQQRMWFLNQFDTDSAAYNIPVAVRLTGALDVGALRQAIEDVLVRHEVLRTVYPDTMEGPVQRLLPVSAWRGGLEVESIEAQALPGRIREVVSAGFDVTTEVPLRTALFEVVPADRGGVDEHILVVVAHHISADGWSMGPLTRDVMVAYAARSGGTEPGWTPLPVQYADFSMWQRRLLGSETDPDSLLAKQIGYWRTALAGLPDELNLPADRPRPSVQSFSGGTISFAVGDDLSRGLRRLARAQNTTLFMVVHTALAVLLARISGTDDIVIGTPVAGRGEAELDDMVGMFVNTLALRTQVRGELSFGELLTQAKEADLGAFAHAEVPFERLVELLNPERSTARHPLFQVALSFRNLPETDFELPGLRVGAVDSGFEVEKFDLSLNFTESGAGMSAEFSFARDLFDAPTVQGFVDRFRRILAAVVADATVTVGDIDLLAPDERGSVLHEWNSRGAWVPGATLPELIADQARRRPDAVAVRFGDTALSFAELRRRANRVARALIAAGAGPEALVAVAVSRSEELPVALLGVLTAGAAYLPIDIAYPAQRLEFVLSDAVPVCVLTTAEQRADVPSGDLPVLLLEEVAEFDDGPISDADRLAPLLPDHLAYVIYTSGSTGVPKGVGVAHRNVVELCANTQPLFGFDETDVWTLFHSFAFDFSVWELWCALATGGAVVVVDYATSRAPELFRELLIRQQVTVLNQTPSAFYQLIEADRAAPDAYGELALKHVIFGGEALDLRQLRRWYERHPSDQPRLVNMYGITETTVHVSYLPLDKQIADNPASLIGRALPGLDGYVLDERLHPVPVGTPGEIYVAGRQLSRGYLGRPGLAAARFVANPFGPPGSRMYRTGDLGRWGHFDDTTSLAYAGRSDQQVQLRGFRVELGEIESALLRCPNVSQAVVLVRSTERTGDQLIGYVVPASGTDLDPDELRVRVAEFLTGYMVPAAIVVLDVMPLTPNGKLDRRALPEPAYQARQYRAPANPLEETVAAAFARVLDLDRFGMDDNFFERGGNSLIATKLTARLSSALGTKIPVMRVFTASTPGEFVTELARRASGHVEGEGAFDVMLPLRRSGSAEPLFCIHPVSGIAWSFAGLAAHLEPGRPIYGVQAPTLAAAAELPETIEEWARLYVDAIRSVQPQGPYHLLGWSMGGVFAHEIAVQLQNAGQQVALLAVMDSYLGDPPSADDGTGAGSPVPVAELIGGLLGELAGDLGSVDTEVDWGKLAERMEELPEPFASFGSDRFTRVLDTAVHSVVLRGAYRPVRFHGDVVYFTAALDDPTGSVGATIWADVVDGAVDNHAVPTNHWQMTAAAGLVEIGRVLTARWNRPVTEIPSEEV